MTGFNFGTTAKPVSTQSFLKAWSIYNNVEFDGISDPTEGTSSSGRKWRRWDMTFRCKEGIYSESIFEPTDAKASERTEIAASNGGTIKLPSNIERLNLIFQQVISVYMNDANKAKFQSLAESGKFNNIEFSKFISVLKKYLENPKKPTEDYPIMLKLQGRKRNDRVYAALPNARISSKDDSAWMERFLGPNLTLSDYESQQAKATTASKPTNMDKIDNTAETQKDDIDDLTGELDDMDL